MKLITKAELVANVPHRWEAQYFRSGKWGVTHSGDTEIVFKALLAVVPLTAEKVNDIIGNTSWTRVECGECRRDVDAAVIFDVGGEYSLYLCFDCLSRASALAEKASA